MQDGQKFVDDMLVASSIILSTCSSDGYSSSVFFLSITASGCLAKYSWSTLLSIFLRWTFWKWALALLDLENKLEHWLHCQRRYFRCLILKWSRIFTLLLMLYGQLGHFLDFSCTSRMCLFNFCLVYRTFLLRVSPTSMGQSGQRSVGSWWTFECPFRLSRVGNAFPQSGQRNSFLKSGLCSMFMWSLIRWGPLNILPHSGHCDNFCLLENSRRL